MKAEVSNLWAFLTVFHDQITPTFPSNKHRLFHRRDQIRNQREQQPKLDKDRRYGSLLFVQPFKSECAAFIPEPSRRSKTGSPPSEEKKVPGLLET